MLMSGICIYLSVELSYLRLLPRRLRSFLLRYTRSLSPPRFSTYPSTPSRYMVEIVFESGWIFAILAYGATELVLFGNSASPQSPVPIKEYPTHTPETPFCHERFSFSLFLCNVPIQNRVFRFGRL